jgi:hypothetical protein
VAAPTADTGAQSNILGHKHLPEIGLDISCLHPTKVTMDCANSTETVALGVFYWYVRGKCKVTGRTLVHLRMIYVIEGDISLLTETALRDS